MPIIRRPNRWLELEVIDPASLVHLFQAYPADLMEMWPVSPMVSKVANDGPELMVPNGDAPVLDLVMLPVDG